MVYFNRRTYELTDIKKGSRAKDIGAFCILMTVRRVWILGKKPWTPAAPTKRSVG